MDNDGLTPSQDPDCMFIKNIGFIPFEDCGDGIDNNADGVTDCDDPMCTYKPMCASGTAFNYIDDASDTTSPSVIFHVVDAFNDSAFIKFDTNEPANGTVFFYAEDSTCQAINYTLYDTGDPYCSGDWCSYDDYKLWHGMPIDNYLGNYYAMGYDLANGTTYYYKYNVCDPSDNCATSACSNFTTEAGTTTFYFDMNPPNGFTVKTPWATGGQIYSQQVDQTQTKDINITIECSTAGYSMVLVGADVKAAQDIDFTDFICSDSTNLIGMPSTKWDSLLFELSVDRVEITWATGGDSAVIYHCETDGTSCTAVTDYLDCTVGASSVTCKIPTTMGFSAYKVITTTDEEETETPASPGGGGGDTGTPAANETINETTTNTTNTDDDEDITVIDSTEEDTAPTGDFGAAISDKIKATNWKTNGTQFIVISVIIILVIFLLMKKRSSGKVKKPYKPVHTAISRRRRANKTRAGDISNYGFKVKKK